MKSSPLSSSSHKQFLHVRGLPIISFCFTRQAYNKRHQSFRCFWPPFIVFSLRVPSTISWYLLQQVIVFLLFSITSHDRCLQVIVFSLFPSTISRNCCQQVNISVLLINMLCIKQAYIIVTMSWKCVWLWVSRFWQTITRDITRSLFSISAVPQIQWTPIKNKCRSKICSAFSTFNGSASFVPQQWRQKQIKSLRIWHNIQWLTNQQNSWYSFGFLSEGKTGQQPSSQQLEKLQSNPVSLHFLQDYRLATSTTTTAISPAQQTLLHIHASFLCRSNPVVASLLRPLILKC